MSKIKTSVIRIGEEDLKEDLKEFLAKLEGKSKPKSEPETESFGPSLLRGIMDDIMGSDPDPDDGGDFEEADSDLVTFPELISGVVAELFDHIEPGDQIVIRQDEIVLTKFAPYERAVFAD